MPRPTGPSNPLLQKTITQLKAERTALGLALARLLSRPERIRAKVNISKLERYGEKGDIIAVPGKVLGSGKLTKALTVGAAAFSKSAKEKIHAAGGKTVKLTQVLKKKGVKIIC